MKTPTGHHHTYISLDENRKIISTKHYDPEDNEIDIISVPEDICLLLHEIAKRITQQKANS